MTTDSNVTITIPRNDMVRSILPPAVCRLETNLISAKLGARSKRQLEDAKKINLGTQKFQLLKIGLYGALAALSILSPGYATATDQAAVMSDQFDTIELVPGAVYEICLPIEKSKEIAFSFSSTHIVEFNVHYHQGTEIRFPIEKTATKSKTESVPIEIAIDHCLTWKNQQNKKTTLRYFYEIN